MQRDVFSDNAKHLLPALSAVFVSAIARSEPLYMLAFFALIPLFIRLKQINGFKSFFITMLIYFGISNFFQLTFLIEVRELLELERPTATLAMLGTTLALTIWLTALNLLPMLIFPKIQTGTIADVFSFSALYVLSEWFLENAPMLEFPWTRLAVLATPYYVFIQSSAVLGSLFISLLLLIINGLCANAFSTKNDRHKQIICLFSALLVFVGNVLFGAVRIIMSENEGTNLEAVILQPNLSPQEKWDLSAKESLEEHYQIAKQAVTSRTRIIALSETAVNTGLNVNEHIRLALIRFSNSFNSTILTGAFYKENGKTYNGLFAVETTGEISEPYLKKILVPFGEYIPAEKLLTKLFPYLSELIQGDGISSSDEQKLVGTRYGKVTATICLESVFPNLVRSLVNKGGELIIVASNDAWFNDSYELDLHFRHSILRAVENNRYLLNSANSGVCAIISPLGKIVDKAVPNTEDFARGNVQFLTAKTPYTVVGDIVILPAVVLLTLGFVKIAKEQAEQLRKR